MQCHLTSGSSKCVHIKILYILLFYISTTIFYITVSHITTYIKLYYHITGHVHDILDFFPTS